MAKIECDGFRTGSRQTPSVSAYSCPPRPITYVGGPLLVAITFWMSTGIGTDGGFSDRSMSAVTLSNGLLAMCDLGGGIGQIRQFEPFEPLDACRLAIGSTLELLSRAAPSTAREFFTRHTSGLP